MYYGIAESLFALFATGMLNHPAMKEALDLSTAAMENATSPLRVGGLGTSLITAPTAVMREYLACRLASDVLLRRDCWGKKAACSPPRRTPR